MRKRIYIAATSQHIGKTTSTLGLVQALRNKNIHVGYCKPVGQEGINFSGIYVDKDAVLFSTVMDFHLQANIHSPVILGPGATTRFLDDPTQFHYEKDILYAAQILEEQYEMVIYEGTGHPGVGSVVDLSNADVAKLLNASVIVVVEGGIGNTIDRLKMSLTMFQERNVPIIGVIVNKVHPDKYEKVKHYVGKKLDEWNIPLLGLIPYDKTLLYPLFDTIMRSVSGRVLLNGENMDNRIEEIVAASLIDSFTFKENQHVLLVVSSNRFHEIIQKIEQKSKELQLTQSPLAGIIITGDGRKEESFSQVEEENYVNLHKIPVIATHLDTYGSAVQISSIEVKINTRTPWKTQRAIELIEEYVDLDKVI